MTDTPFHIEYAQTARREDLEGLAADLDELSHLERRAARVIRQQWRRPRALGERLAALINFCLFGRWPR